MFLFLPATYLINDDQELSLFEDGSGFVFEKGVLSFDFQFTLEEDALLITLNDDASWGKLSLNDQTLQGKLYSHISHVKSISWSMKKIPLRSKPEALTALQAIRFHDKESLLRLTQNATNLLWNELLIEAATCGHIEMLNYCYDQGALLHVNIEDYSPDENGSSLALSKAIQCGHLDIVKRLLDLGAHIHHHSFDLDRDNFYHACFLYQVRVDCGEAVIDLLLSKGVDFSHMSAYYLCALMYIFPKGPLNQACEDIKAFQKVIKAGARVDDFMMINAHEKDTPFMFAAHMGFLQSLEVLVDAQANVFESYQGANALDRLVHPLVIDPQMPHDKDEKVRDYLLELGLTESERESEESRDIVEDEEVKKEDISSLEKLFDNLNS